MTLQARQTVSFIGFIVTIFFSVLFIIVTVLLQVRYGYFQGGFPEVGLYESFGIPAFLAVLSVGGWLYVRLSFEKTASAEIFFYSFFLVSLSFETLKMTQLMLIAMEEPFIFNVLLTRIIFFGRFFGLLCLFFSGMFSSWLQYQRIGLVLSISLLFPVALALVIPVSTDLGNDLLYTLGIQKELGVTFYALETFAVLNYILSGVVLNNKEYIWMSSGILMIIVGREFLFQGSGLLVLILGIGFLTVGSLLFGKKAHNVYLWR